MFRTLFILVFLLSVSACGFQLRGAVKLPSDLQPLYLYNADADELAHQLSVLLRENHAQLAADEQQAASRLKIVSQNRTRRVLSVDSLGRAREYELHYSVLYQLKGQHIDVENVIKLQRVLTFDPGSVLGTSSEEKTLYHDMQMDAARLILQQIDALTKKNRHPDAASS